MRDKGKNTKVIMFTLLFIICLSLCVLGFFKYRSGYGNSGKVRNDLVPIINNFNESTEIKNLSTSNTSINAKLGSSSIIVEYRVNTNISKYTFDYIQEGNFNILAFSYSSLEAAKAEIIIRSMIEAISMAHGNANGQVFDTYIYKDFFHTTLEQGAKLEENESGTSINAKLNINANIIENLVTQDIESLRSGDDFKDVLVKEIKKVYYSTLEQYKYEDLSNYKYMYVSNLNCRNTSNTVTYTLTNVDDKLSYELQIDRVGNISLFRANYKTGSYTNNFSLEYKGDNFDISKINDYLIEQTKPFAISCATK